MIVRRKNPAPRQLQLELPLGLLPPRTAAQHQRTTTRLRPQPGTAIPAQLPRGRDATLEAHARQLLQRIGFAAIGRRLRVEWNPRLTTTAGLAWWQAAKVELNPRLLHYAPGEIDSTLRHELAHLVAQNRAGWRRIATHGEEWRRACAQLGIPNESSSHSIPLPRRKIPRKHLYLCPNCGDTYPRVRPFLRAVACSKCCRRHSEGTYDHRFRLVKVDKPKAR